MSWIDPQAPVRSEAAATTPADRATVFGLLADLAGWSDVYPELRDLEATGPATLGAAFRFRSGPMLIEAEVTGFEADRLVAFEGRAKAASSTYVFRLEDNGSGGTTIHGAQSMDGMAVRTMRPMLQKIADKSLQDWVTAIARAAAT